MSYQYQLIVIGSGSAGKDAAILAARAGQRVLLVEKESLGTAACYQSAQKNLASVKTAAPRTRGSARRASGFVQIPITLNLRSSDDERLP